MTSTLVKASDCLKCVLYLRQFIYRDHCYQICKIGCGKSYQRKLLKNVIKEGNYSHTIYFWPLKKSRKNYWLTVVVWGVLVCRAGVLYEGKVRQHLPSLTKVHQLPTRDQHHLQNISVTKQKTKIVFCHLLPKRREYIIQKQGSLAGFFLQ